MSSYRHPQTTASSQITHSKELALDDVEYEALYQGASDIDDELMALQAQLAVTTLGRLGLRAGELAHLREEWIDWRRQIIEIPRHQPCRKGRDGGACGRCCRLAEQRVAHADDLTYEEAVAETWSPKTAAGIRGVFFGWSARTQYVLEEFFEMWSEWPRSVQVVARRVERAAAQTTAVDPEEISPHPLRATAASHLAGRGLGHSALMQFFGWSDYSVASRYIERSTSATARQLSSLNSR